jgi:hypothetical protein
MEISKLKRKEAQGFRCSVYYSAVIDETKLVEYSTDGVFNKHLTLEEWEQYVKDNLK